MRVQKFEDWNRANESKSEPEVVELKGPTITVDEKEIKTTWIVTLQNGAKSIDDKGTQWELYIKDKKSLSDLKKLGIKFEEPHTYIFDVIKKTSSILKDGDIAKLIKGVTKEQFVKMANHNHGASTFELSK